MATPAYGDVAVTAVGPGIALAGETVTFEFFITADPGFLMRGYVITPPCALTPQEGAQGRVDAAEIALDNGRPDWAMCGAPCNCTCAAVPVLDGGSCQVPCTVDGPEPEDDSCSLEHDPPGPGGTCMDGICIPFRDPRVGWATIFTSDSAAVGVGPAYLAETSYTISGDASGGFNFEFVDPETPEGGSGSTLRDQDSLQVFADWIGDKLVVFDCFEDTDCDDGLHCNGVETCVTGECQDGVSPCTDGELPNCDEDEDACVECAADAHCDDGVVCNGLELCVDNECQPGANEPDGTPCGNADETDCTDPDSCDGAGNCAANDEPPGTPCPDDGNECTADECDGGGACTHPNLDAGSLCADDGNECTADECDGVGACTHPDQPAGIACGDGSDTDCTDPDTCDGAGSCQVNHTQGGTACSDDGNECTADECDENGTCSHPFEPAGTVCSDDGNECTADECDGTGTCSHPDLGDGTPCSEDANDCTDDVCLAGLCEHNCSPGSGCDDGNPCTDDDTCFDDGDDCFCEGTLNPSCNETCLDAVQVFEGTTEGSNESAVAEDDAEATCQPDSNHDVWFFFDPTCDGEIWIRSSAVDPVDFDSVLSVFSAACYDVEIACDDDSGAGLDAVVTFFAFSDSRYWIRVAGFQKQVGTFDLTILTVNDCLIDGVCYANGAINPQNDCLACVPEVSTTEWTPRPEGSSCGNPSASELGLLECDNPDACDGAGVCEPNHKPDGTECSDEGNDCTSNLCETGVCVHPPLPTGTPCGDPTDSECDNPDTCDEAATCLGNFEPEGVACGDPSDTDCDNPDNCDGSGGCQDDLEEDDTACTKDANECTDDVCEFGVCEHPPSLAGTPCGNQDDSPCDHPDTCDGAAECLDNFESDFEPCDDGDVCTGTDECFSGTCVGTPIPEAPIVEAVGTRTLAVTPQPEGSSAPVALLVTSPDWPCLLKYVDSDGSLTDTPVSRLPEDWDTIFVSGADIIPSTPYAVQAECGVPLSSAGVDTTWLWGDVDDDDFVGIDDVLCMLDGFANDFSTCSLENLDILPCEVNGMIDIDDILGLLDAFAGLPYPCPEPCS